MTDEGVRVHQSALSRHEDGVSRVETRLVGARDEPGAQVQLLVEELRFGRGVLPFLPSATVARLREELTAHLNAAELSWYPRSKAARDLHRGVLSHEGMVSAVCGVRFHPQATAGCPPDPERVCLACCRVMPG